MKKKVRKISMLQIYLFLGVIIVSVLFTNAYSQDRSAAKAVSAYMEGKYSEAEAFVDLGTEVEDDLEMSYVVDGFLLIRKEKYLTALEGLRPCYWDKAEGNKRQYCLLTGMYSVYLSHLDNGYDKESEVVVDVVNKIKGSLKKMQPKTALQYYVRSFGYKVTDRPAESQADLTKAIQLNPRFVLAYLRRGDMYLRDNQKQAALADYKKALEVNPRCPSAYAYRGNFYSTQENYDLAIADYTKAIELEPDLEIHYNNRGNVYRWSKQNDLALRDYNRAIEINPKYAEPYVNRGIIYLYDKKQNDIAYADFSKSLDLRKGNPWANYFVGLMKLWYNNSKDYYGAADNLKAAIKQDPSIREAYRDLGVALSNLGKYDEALTALNKSIEVMPNNVNAYFDRGIVKRDIGDYNGAIADYTKYIGFGLNDTGAYYNRAQIYFHDIQKFDLAIVDYTKVIELNPKYWEAYFNRANVYESIGNQKAADADYKKLKDLKEVTLKDYKKYTKYLYPNSIFDASLAQNLLSPGTSTIAGRACAYEAKTKFDARYTKVFLYPVTPYFEAWYELRKKQEDKTTVVYVSKEAARYRRETQTNEEGKFVFDNLKPGRYFIQIIFDFTRAGTDRRYGGSSTEVVNGVLTTTNYYYDQDYRFDYTKRLEEFVEVKSEGETTKVDLKKGWGGILAKGCSRPF